MTYDEAYRELFWKQKPSSYQMSVISDDFSKDSSLILFRGILNMMSVVGLVMLIVYANSDLQALVNFP